MAKNQNAHDDHAPNVGAYIKVFGALMVLTGVTVVISKFHLPRPQAIALGLLVATIKASLVAAVFMHLWGENRIIHRMLWITGACALILIIPLVDATHVFHHATARVSVAEQRPGEAAEAKPEAAEPAKAPAPKPAKEAKKK